MKTYRISEANLSTPPEVVVIMNLGTAGSHRVLLSGAAAYLKSQRGLIGRMPQSVTLEDGRKVGAFPCITALTERAAAGLTALVGYDIAVGDGVRCCTQLQARERVEVLIHAHSVVAKDDLRCEWMVSKPEPTTHSKRPTSTEEEREQMLNDSPF